MTTGSDAVGGRIALGVEYDGARFNGWQVQPDARTVQRDLEVALAAVAAEPIATICAGRTDTGVHAIYQVVHFDTEAARTERAWRMGVNANLRADVAVRWACRVDADFHARFGALARRYSYLILNQREPSPIYRQRACWERRPLDAEVMHRAAQALVGEHDFSAFRAASCQAANPFRIVNRIDVVRRGAWLRIDIEANAFLQNMVRIIAGALVRVGCGEAPAAWLAQVLAGRDRGHRGDTAQAEGLYLTAVRYAPKYALPKPAEGYLPGD